MQNAIIVVLEENAGREIVQSIGFNYYVGGGFRLLQALWTICPVGCLEFG